MVVDLIIHELKQEEESSPLKRRMPMNECIYASHPPAVSNTHPPAVPHQLLFWVLTLIQMLLPSSTTYLIAPLYFTSLPFTLLLISFFTIIFFNKINYILMIFWNVVKKIKITSDLINLADNIYKARNIIKSFAIFNTYLSFKSKIK